MIKLLCDENISPLTVGYIRSLGYDVKSVVELGLKGAADEEIVSLAKRERRIIVTFDLDFGETHYFSSKEEIGIIVLRLKSQWHEEVNRALEKILKTKKLEAEEYKKSLLIITEKKYRFRKHYK